nr:MAG TPA: hypothetical protein [Caudoviricetes sp.]
MEIANVALLFFCLFPFCLFLVYTFLLLDNVYFSRIN